MAHSSVSTRRGRTNDRGPPGDGPPEDPRRVTILTVHQLGPQRFKLPNGSLLCRNVPIARTGWMMYAPGEIPLRAAGNSPVIYVYRDSTALFTPEAMGSFIGAAVTNGHPPVDVTPKNWKTLAGGYCIDVRRGEGEDSDCLLGDLIITDQYLINAIDNGTREVSAGYDASYQQTGDGEGRQFDIIGNHIALVQKGRCGARCAIGDQHPTTKETKMKRVPLIDALRQTLDTLEQDEGTANEEGVHIHVHTGDAKPKVDDEPPAGDDDPLAQRVATIETGMSAMQATLAEIAAAVKSPKAPTTDDGAAAAAAAAAALATGGDSMALQTSYTELLSQAEIIVPGFRAPTFDAALPRAKTVDSMCQVRRKVLDVAAATKDGAELLGSLTGKQELNLADMSCVDVATIFRAAATVKAQANNRAATGDSLRVPNTAHQQQAVTIADINKRNASFWGNQTAVA